MRFKIWLLILLFLPRLCFAYDYPSLTYSFVAGQLISAAKVMQNYNDSITGVTSGTKKVNVAELYIAGSLAIDDDKDLTVKAISGTGAITVSGNISGAGDLTVSGNMTATTLNAIILGGNMTGGSNTISGSDFQISGGSITAISTFNVNCDIINAATYDLDLDGSTMFYNGGQNKLLLSNSNPSNETYISSYGIIDIGGSASTRYIRGGEFDGDPAFLISGDGTHGNGQLALYDVGTSIRWFLTAEDASGTDSYYSPSNANSGFAIGSTTTSYDFDVSGSGNIDVLDCNTINTGQGDNEVYAMNQDLETSDAVEFNTITTTGINEPSAILNGDWEIQLDTSTFTLDNDNNGNNTSMYFKADTAGGSENWTYVSFDPDEGDDGILVALDGMIFNTPIYCRAEKTDQSIPTSSETIILWDSEDADTDSIHSTSSNTGYFYAPYSGFYTVYFKLVLDDLGSADITVIGYQKSSGGSTITTPYRQKLTLPSDARSTVCGTYSLALSKGSYTYISITADEAGEVEQQISSTDSSYFLIKAN